ncbi:MAG: PTS system mannose/fructose/sorbose family transporter subunit IID [candidate division FCPU426 bacterium]
MNPTLWRMVLRSFFIQCAWNFERMQNLGFAFAMAPALKRLYPDKERRIMALRRHMEFYNSHPFMSPLILGSALRVEEDALAAGKEPGAMVSSLKQGLMGPLAAIGDALFWNTLRPLATLASAALLWALPQVQPLVVAGLYLAIFNLPHLAFRILGIRQGYALGVQVAGFLAKVDTQKIIARLRIVALVVMGAALACLGRLKDPGGPASLPFGGDLGFVGQGFVMLVALRLKVPVTWILAGAGLLAFTPFLRTL